jgi:hypothetical protein
MRERRKVETWKEITGQMVKELEHARETLRQQLSGVENQLFVLTKLVERMEAAEKEREPEPEPESEPEPEPIDPLSAMGLSSEAGTGQESESESELVCEPQPEDEPGR